MRTVNYLFDKASSLNQDPKTLAVIDRAMVESGLRRKGKGRAIPWPTLREDLMFTLAIMGRSSIASAVEDSKQWASLPCISGRGFFYESHRSETLIECLESLCAVISDPASSEQELSNRLILELDFSWQGATIAFRNEAQDHLSFEIRGIRKGFQARMIAEVKAGYFVELARTPRDP